MSGAESQAVAETGRPQSRRDRLDQFFKISERGSSVGTEVRGGLATFFAMAYIIVLNPLIIGNVADLDGQFLGDMSAAPDALPLIAAATALVAAVMTILMGVVGNYPFAIATGLGLNAFVAVGIATQMSWEDAMGLVVLEGIIITVLVLTGFRTTVFLAIPTPLKTSIAVGIGLFIALIGFVNAGFVQPGIPLLQLGTSNSVDGWALFVFVVGLLATAVMVARKVKAAILLGIIGTTVLAIIVEAMADLGVRPLNEKGWGINEPQWPDQVVDTPDLSLLGQFSLFGGFAEAGVTVAVLLVFTLLLADFFDTMGTITGVGTEAGLVDKSGNLPNADRVLLVDSLAAAAGGAASTSSNTTYVESAAGVGEGAKTGLASVVTGVLFLGALFFTPLVRIVPSEAAAPALVVVGMLLITQVRNIDFGDLEVAVPAFFAIVLMPFTFSITNGIGAGFIAYVVIKLARGKFREIHWLMWIIAALFVIYFGIEPIERLLT